MSQFKSMPNYKKKQLKYAFTAVKNLQKSLKHSRGCTADAVVDFVMRLRSKHKPTAKEALTRGVRNALKTGVKLGLIYKINGYYLTRVELKEERSIIGGDPLFHIEKWLLTGNCDSSKNVKENSNYLSPEPGVSGISALQLNSLTGEKENADTHIRNWLEKSSGEDVRNPRCEMNFYNCAELGNGIVDVSRINDETLVDVGDSVSQVSTVRELTYAQQWRAEHFGKDSKYTDAKNRDENQKKPEHRRGDKEARKKSKKRIRSQECSALVEPPSRVSKKKVVVKTAKVNKRKVNNNQLAKMKPAGKKKCKAFLLRKMVDKCKLKRKLTCDKNLTPEQIDYYKTIIDDYLPRVADSNTFLRVQSKLLSLKCKQMTTKYEKPKTKENDFYVRRLNERIKSASAMVFLLKKLNEE